jgi:hypothetical protein
MRKIILIIIVGIFLITTIPSCEKDDICPADTPTTPLLLITFYDDLNRTELKQVTTLRVVTGDNDDQVNTIEDSTNTDSIALPLKVFDTATAFKLIADSQNDSTDIEIGNADIVTFSYDNKEVFISRGCGFANNYENLTETLNNGGDAPWILGIEIQNTTVENQTTAHVKIFH